MASLIAQFVWVSVEHKRNKVKRKLKAAVQKTLKKNAGLIAPTVLMILISERHMLMRGFGVLIVLVKNYVEILNAISVLRNLSPAMKKQNIGRIKMN